MSNPGKRDAYYTDKIWDKWKSKNKSIDNISKHNSNLILQFLDDFEQGKNVPKSRKGRRSSTRLLTLKSKLSVFSRIIDDKDLDKLSKDDIHRIFTDLRNGKIHKKTPSGADGGAYMSVDNILKDFKTFWNWLIKTKRVTEDIAEDLGKEDDKPSWVYLSEEQFKDLGNKANAEYRPLIWLLYDSGMRGREAWSIKVNDFSDDFKVLTIRDEISKNNRGRKINLKLCSQLIKDLVRTNNLKDDDFIFDKTPQSFNKYLKRLSLKLFGDKVSNPKAKGKYGSFTSYDIRHNAACYWLKRYQKQSALMYRLGWSTPEMIGYYSEFLGMNDEISDEDMILAEDKDRLRKLEEKIENLNEIVAQLVEVEAKKHKIKIK